ncbi:MAG: hypothetical protein WCV90_02760 [Candidatus Woesearchaeota archaeon]|jgi:hypothetical protein
MDQIYSLRTKVTGLLERISPQLDEIISLEEVVYSVVDQERRFTIEPNGFFNYRGKDPFIVGECCKKKMTSTHQLRYFGRIAGLLQEYLSLVENNVKVCPSYQFPRMERDQIEEIAERAFSESFAETRRSYIREVGN